MLVSDNLISYLNQSCAKYSLLEHKPTLTSEESLSVRIEAGYKNIADIGKERIRRAAKNIKEENCLTCNKPPLKGLIWDKKLQKCNFCEDIRTC